MASADIQGELWGRSPQGWANIQEPLHTPLWEAMLEATEIGSDSTLLDVGCGGGGASVLAASRGARISGIDAASELIKFARDRLPDGGFHVGDLEELPFEDNQFDAVFAANAIQYAADRVRALAECGRVCRPGGRVVAGLFGPPEHVKIGRIFKAARDAMPEPPSGGGPFELSSPGVLEGLFEEAGLAVIGTGEADCPFHYSDLETFWQANVSAGPFQGMLQVVEEAHLKAAVLAAADAFVLPDGRVSIGPNIFRFVVGTPQ